MSFLFAYAFEYRNRRTYFCDGDGAAYPLEPGEAEKIAFQLGLVLAVGLVGFALWSGYALYATALRLDLSGSAASAWLLDPKIIYPAVTGYWVLAWLLSKAAWFGLSLRFADRQADYGIGPGLASKSLKATKPLPTLVLGVFMIAFAAQALGDACFVFRGSGSCAIVTITPS